MKRKILIITASTLLLGVLLCAVYYFFYLKKIVIYDLVNIEISGISPDEMTAIKIIGITPVNKKISLHNSDKIYANNFPGCYQTIEIVIPDSLIPKATYIRATLKRIEYTIKINDLHPTPSSNNAHTYILPPEVKSEGTFFNKLSLAYPFNKVLPVLKIVLLAVLYITGILLFIFCIGYLWKLINHIKQKRFIQKINIFLQEKKRQYLILFIIFILLLALPILWPDKINIKYFLVVLFYISFVIQRLFFIKKSYVLFLFRTLIIIFFCFEAIFGELNHSKIGKEYNNNFNLELSDSRMGYRQKPNCNRVRSVKTVGGDTIYNIKVTTDKFGRRISGEKIFIDTTRGKIYKKKHAIFLGCSVTFGQGLSDSSTFPFLFEYRHPDFKSYNYGTTGYGPHQLCLLFDEGINTITNSTVPEDSGICVYTYIDDHMNRVYGSSKYLSWALNPHDAYVNNNKLIIKNLSNIKKFISWFLNNSETMKYFHIITSYPKSEEFYKRFADLINYMAVKYRKIKPQGGFYVGLYPGYAHDTSWVKFLDKNITVLNIPPPIDFDTNFSSYTIKGDVHPTKKLNSYYTKEISNLIFKKNKNGLLK